MQTVQQNKNRLLNAALLLSLLIGLCYSNSLKASWHLDDTPNIVANPKIHMSSLSLDSIYTSFHACPESDHLYRPIVMFSFALNWLAGQDEVTGYHLVNIAIHLLSAVFLFLASLALLLSPAMKKMDQDRVFSIALLSAVFWAVHPIQIQAVTYIVQRMASLAALFYIVAIWAFLSGRSCEIRYKKNIWFAGCLLSYGLALSSKQNTLFLPVTLLLIEMIFFQDLRNPIVKKQFLRVLTAGLTILVLGFVFMLFAPELLSVMDKYQIRKFTPLERLLTQFRVVLFYLSQMVYPMPARFSIIHDFSISRSLFTPWTTLPSVLMVLGMSVTAFRAIFKGPFLKISGFAVLFFLVNHIIESTILPLEMVFEHRNYLPSFFLFLPVSMGIENALHYYKHQNRLMPYFIAFSTCVLLISMGTITYMRNMDWRSEKTLWLDAMAKAPNSARPPHNLAWGYYAPAGQFDRAIDLYQRALQLNDESIGSEATVYFNLAAIYFSNLRDYEKTVFYSEKTLRINGAHARAASLLAGALARLGRYDDALKVIQFNGDHVNSIYYKGLVLLNMSKPEAALAAFRQCLIFEPHNGLYLREIGFSFGMMNMPVRAGWFFRLADSKLPNQPEILLGMAAASLETGLLTEATTYVERFMLAVGAENVEAYWTKAKKNPLGLPIPYQRLEPLISDRLIKKSIAYSDFSRRLTKNINSD
ncbi:MAG: tetratricopeptide repeat protein [Desulfobacteraceae bacterium]|nr:MAG: tetratricopeptide repeat protein [Desulfobacteraceae bacterium]